MAGSTGCRLEDPAVQGKGSDEGHEGVLERIEIALAVPIETQQSGLE